MVVDIDGVLVLAHSEKEDAAATCLKGWPKGMRLVVHKERPHLGVQLRITDVDGIRITCFAHQHREHPDRTAGAATPPARES